MDSPLNNIEFLSRSPHRVAVLQALIEEPHDRSELREATGASSSTLGRILSDFGEQGWTTRPDHRYVATPLGELVGREFTRLLTTMEAVEQLHEAIVWLPTEEMNFDLGALQDAEVTTATKSNPFMPILAMAGRLSAADKVQLLSNMAIPQTLAAIRESVVNASQTFEAVVTHDLLDAIATDEMMSTHSQELLESEHTEVFEYDGEIPCNMVIADETVMIGVTDDQQMPRALIETDDKRVMSWATSTYRCYQCESEPINSTQYVV